MSNTLPKGLTVRPAMLDDVEAIYSLVQAYDYALYGVADKSLASVRGRYSAPGLDLAEDTCLAFDQAGQLVGSMLLEQTLYAKFFVRVHILPGYPDQRLGDYLMGLAESRAREQMARAQPDARVTMIGWVPSVDQAGFQRYRQAGFQEIRRHWRMEIELHEAPAAPEWPQGVELRPFVTKRDEHAVFELIDTAFQDHWGYMPQRFEEWRHWAIERADFDPSLYFVAYADEQPVGCALCFANPIGWVDDLGVARVGRRKGLGLALLRHAFGEFYHRGWHKAGLGVDAQNLTGATRLYQRAGMHIAREDVVHEKELRAGVDLSVQTLEV
jgi:ribosomal protein S18 acetylase RimI-like enzyme